MIAGEAYGTRSPVETLSPLFYVEARLEPGAHLQIPVDYQERAAYVVTGAVGCGARAFDPRTWSSSPPAARRRSSRRAERT